MNILPGAWLYYSGDTDGCSSPNRPTQNTTEQPL
ncbi:unknown (plasmid) [Haloarcula marismortui ATCC 43049]|uniref:Uncharacterized protein n=1 Tax=Haloarcula marismortui (strain ATCC 43049 / DSM 3752 / JCM 8966 / VKM B-1809) TaxID=272569 RepID=Q5V5Z9_HALMA|nr:unknown [Haloarcula marismortui ATCC 43049]